ncbi:hypothetical protein VNI00_012389 [Paramarasmius palmivorus]|uniref:F-box domain-containing protein n=1 Tax=Paramarasmius palmivorus TaxID=297713 RepID=A0AAW0C7B9_9AGAR
MTSHRRKLARLNTLPEYASVESFPLPSHARSGTDLEINVQSKLLLSVPLDIIFLICSFLPVKSLFELTRTCRMFRNTLLSQTGVSIWIALRNSFDAPPPMPGMSESQWAHLLWGSGTHCQVCGTTNVKRVDFILRKRICFACVKKKGIPRGGFKRRYRGADPIVLDFVLPTSGGSRGANGGYYNCEEIGKVVEELGLCRESKEKDEYIQERKDFLRECEEHARRCERWVAEYRARKTDETDSLCAARLQAIHKLLRDMGYSEDDMEDVEFLQCARRPTPLTDQSWKMISPSVIACIRGHRTFRMIEEDDGILASRRIMFDRLFTEYRRSLKPHQWRRLPSVETIRLLHPVNEVLVRPDSQPIVEKDLLALSETLRHEVECWITEQRQDLVADLEEELGYLTPSEVEVCPKPEPRSLDLAVTVIRCYQCFRHWSTLEGAIRHLHTESCRRENHLQISRMFKWIHSLVARLLVIKSNLDVDSATPDDMDDLGAFYQCVACNQHESEPFIGTWRECVISHTHLSSVPRFKVLDEAGSPEDRRECWACNICNAHVDKLATRSGLLEHLKSKHQVNRARAPRDFFYSGE